MKKTLSISLSFVLLCVVATAALAQKAPDVEKHPSCKLCGMDRDHFGYSRFLIEYDDGSALAACSIHCAAVDLVVNIDKIPKSLQVGDYNTRKLIDAETATWVIGGDKPGVMSKNAKWAFENKADAEKYVKEHGGRIGTFELAMQASFEDMYADTKMIREKRKMKRMGTQSHQQHEPQQHQHKP